MHAVLNSHDPVTTTSAYTRVMLRGATLDMHPGTLDDVRTQYKVLLPNLLRVLVFVEATLFEYRRFILSRVKRKRATVNRMLSNMATETLHDHGQSQQN